jgi:broad specificity phosphatase PhoE
MDNKNYSTIYIVRHGESEANVVDTYGLDKKLTEKGRKQAKTLALKFKKIHFDAFFTSPLVRAKETAEIIASEHSLEVLTKYALRERFTGELEGRLVDEVRKELKHIYEMRRNLPYDKWKTTEIAKGYESDDQLMSRFITAIREIAVGYPQKTVLIASHVGLMRTLLVHLGTTTYKDVMDMHFENTGYIKLKTDGIDFFIEEIVGLKKYDEIYQ